MATDRRPPNLLGLALACLMLVCVAVNTASAQQPPPPAPGGVRPPPGAPRPAAAYGAPAPGYPTAGGVTTSNPATGGNSTAGASGVLRMMVPDSGSPSRTAAPAGNGQPLFPASPPAGANPAGSSRITNDPTVPTPEIRAILEGTTRENGPAPQPTVPTMRVRARVFVAGQPPVAVLEINGRQVTVREGSEIYVWGDAGVGMQMRVARMTAGELRLEVVNKNQFFTLD